MEPSADDDRNPPPAARVARRALALAAVVCRSHSDHDPDNPDAIQLWQSLKDWIALLKLDSEFEDHERALIYAPLGSLNKQERIRATWRTEGLAILAWSLGFFPFPRIDAQVDPYEVTDSVAFLDPEMVNTVTTAKLRPAAELDACRDFYYAIHCRFRQCMRKPGSHDIRHWFEKEWFQLLATESQFDESGDLLVNGTSISELDAQTLSKCESIVYQRHLASVWLVGEYGPVYSEVPVDT